MNIIALLSPYFERYITLDRVDSYASYNYKARNIFGLPVIKATLHRPKCSPDSWLYLAVPMSASLASLQPGERLYVGSQTGDRMFRGDGLGGKNFHHAQMRAGNGNDNPVNLLRTGQRIDIHRISAEQIRRAVAELLELRHLQPLLNQPTKHVGYWIEQLTLHTQKGLWRWNTAPADGPAVALFRTLHHTPQLA